MATVTKWIVGRDVAVTVTPQTIDANGVLTAVGGSAKSFVGKADRVELSNSPEKQDISAMDGLYQNQVLLKDNFSLNLVEVQKRVGCDVLALMVGGWDYFQVVAVLGAKTLTFYGTRGQGNAQFETGKSPATMSFDQIDIGYPNPTYA